MDAAQVFLSMSLPYYISGSFLSSHVILVSRITTSTAQSNSIQCNALSHHLIAAPLGLCTHSSRRPLVLMFLRSHRPSCTDPLVRFVLLGASEKQVPHPGIVGVDLV